MRFLPTDADQGLWRATEPLDRKNLDHTTAGAADPAELQRAIEAAAHLTQVGGAAAFTAGARVPTTKAERALVAIRKARTYVRHERPKFWRPRQKGGTCTVWGGFTNLLLHGAERSAGLVEQFRALSDAELDGVAMLAYAEVVQEDRAAGRWFPEGATTLALCRVWKRRGLITGYRWLSTMAEVLLEMPDRPVSFGIDWPEGLDDPDRKYNHSRWQGDFRGGHFITADALDLDDGTMWLHNTWGADFGRAGRQEVPCGDMGRALAQWGEAVAWDRNPEARLPADWLPGRLRA